MRVLLKKTNNNFKKYFLIDVVDVRKDRLKRLKIILKSIIRLQIIKSLYKKIFIVFITVPPHLHLDVAKRAVKFNSGIFIEKPLGMDVNGWFKVYKNVKKKLIITWLIAIDLCHIRID